MGENLTDYDWPESNISGLGSGTEEATEEHNKKIPERGNV